MTLEIEISGPDVLVAGTQVGFDVTITASHDTRVSSVDVRLFGRHSWLVGNHKKTVEHVYPDSMTRVMANGVLLAGRSTFQVSATLPADLAPSHNSRRASARFEARVDIAGPLSVSRTVVFQTRIPPPAVPLLRAPAVASSPVLLDDAPYLELQLPSTQWYAGETITGWIAAHRFPKKWNRQVDLLLVPVFRVMGHDECVGHGIAFRTQIPEGQTGVAFEIRVPQDALQSFISHNQHLEWRVTATALWWWQPVVVAIPVAIAQLPGTPMRPLEPAHRSLAGGQLFASGSLYGRWQRTHVDAVHPAMTRTQGDYAIQIAESADGLVTTIAGPSLGLDLFVRPCSWLHDRLVPDLEVGLAAWDRAHHARARDADQARPVINAMIPALADATRTLGELRLWDDDELVFVRAYAQAVAPLPELETSLQHLIVTLDGARVLLAPPRGIQVDLEAWRELAAELHGVLRVGDLAIEGARDGLPVGVGLKRDAHGVAFQVRVRVGDPSTPAAPRGLRLALADPSADPAIANAVASWPPDVADLRIEHGVVRASLPIAATTEPQRIRDLVTTLLALGAPSRGSGPYR